jgi:hypothetical protein
MDAWRALLDPPDVPRGRPELDLIPAQVYQFGNLQAVPIGHKHRLSWPSVARGYWAPRRESAFCGFDGRETLEFLFQNFYRPRGNDGGLAPLLIELHLLEEKRL